MTTDKNEPQKSRKAPNTDNPKPDGIITEAILKEVNELTNPENLQANWHMLKVLEPTFYKEVLRVTNETKTFFRGKGISGEALDRIGDVVTTFYVKGLMTHRNAINKYQANILDELYKCDYDAYCDQLIDRALAEGKGKPKVKKSRIESIEPSKKKSGLKDLISEEDLGEKRD